MWCGGVVNLAEQTEDGRRNGQLVFLESDCDAKNEEEEKFKRWIL
jgi:hypothetical protein